MERAVSAHNSGEVSLWKKAVRIYDHLKERRYFMPNNAKVTLIGNLVRDPEVRDVNNTKVLSFTVAVSTLTKREDGQYESNFYDCSYWWPRAEHLTERLQKSTQVVVFGDLQQVEYTDKEGNHRARLRVNVSDVRPLARQKGAEEAMAARAAAQAQPPAPVQPDNDLPF